MNSTSDLSSEMIPEDLKCSCGEPMKITRDEGLSPISCPQCGSHVCIDDPHDFDLAVNLLRRYWLERGRQDYAGVDVRP